MPVPTYVNPTNRNTGDLITAGIYNNDLVGNILHLKALHAAFAIIEDQQTAGTQGGGFTSGSWQTHVLNTIASDVYGLISSLSGNRFTPIAGTYRFRARGCGHLVDSFRYRIQNIVSLAVIGQSDNGRASSGAGTMPWVELEGRFTANGTDSYELQGWCQTTRVTDGFGLAFNVSLPEIYGRIVLEYLSP